MTDKPLNPFREKVFSLLAKQGDDKSTDALIAALTESIDNGDTLYTGYIAEALLKSSNQKGREALVLHFDDIPVQQRTAIDLQPNSFQGTALRMLKAHDKEEKLKGLDYIKHSGDDTALSHLAPLMKTQDPDIREKAVDASIKLVFEAYEKNKDIFEFEVKPKEKEQKRGQQQRREIERKKRNMLQILSEAFNSYTVHRNDDVINMAFKFGKMAFPMIQNHVSGHSVLAKRLHHLICAEQNDNHIAFLLYLFRNESPEANVHGNLMLSKINPAQLAKNLERYFMSIPGYQRNNIFSKSMGQAWWHVLLEQLDGLSETFALHMVEGAEKSDNDREQIITCSAMLQSKQYLPKFAALKLLEEINSTQSWWKMAIVFDSSPVEIQIHAMKQLIESTIPEKLQIIAPLVNAESKTVRDMAIKQISRVSLDRYINSFSKLDDKNRQTAAIALEKIDPNLIDELAEMLEAMNPKHRLHAVQIIQLLGKEKEVHNKLLDLLRDRDPKIRASVVRAVGMLGTAAALKAILKTIKDPDLRVRANAIEAFEQLQHPKIQELIRPLRVHPDNRIRGNAVKALILMKDDLSLEALTAMINHENTMMRRTAVWVLRESKLEDAIAQLREMEKIEDKPIILQKIEQAIQHITDRED